MINRLYKLFPDRSVILKLTVLHVALALLQGVLLGILMPIVKELLQPEPAIAVITPWLVTGAAGFLLYLILSIIATPVGFGASMQLAAQLRHDVMHQITQLPLGWFTADRKSRLARTLTADIGSVAQLAVTIGAPAIVAIVVPSTIIVVAFFINWQTGLLFLAVMPVALLVLGWAGRVAAVAETELEHAATGIAGKAIELGQAQTVLRAAGKGLEGTALLQKTLSEHRTVYRKGLQRSLLPDLSYTGIVMFGFISVIMLVTTLFIRQHISIPETIVLFILAVRFLEPLSHLIELIGALRAMDNAIHRIQQVLETPTLPMEKDAVTGFNDASIRIDNISFSYGQHPVLSNVSLYCPQGSTTALIGASGSGKTTLIRMIARFYDVSEGTVSIGGNDIKKLDYGSMMNDIAIIFQDVYLFDASIKENILIAKPDATATELNEAATAAQLHEMLERFPDGWETKAGESGLRLSGGERQRVSIARAFLKKARIVLIDEAASALDPENEQAISKAIANLAKDSNRTVIVIAHRPATIAAANTIVVLDKGKVVECGNPAELLKENGHYATFLQQHLQRREWKVDA